MIAAASKRIVEKWVTPVSVPIFASEFPIVPYPAHGFQTPPDVNKDLLKIAKSPFPLIGLFVPKVYDTTVSHQHLEDFHPVGTLAEIRLKILSDGTVHVLFIPFRRIKAVAMNAEPDNNVITQIVNYGTPIPDLNNVDDEEVNELRAGDLAVYNSIQSLHARLKAAGFKNTLIPRENDIALAPYSYLWNIVKTFMFEKPVLQRFHEIGSLKEQQVFLIAYVKTIRVEDNKEPNANPQYRTRLMEMLNQVNQRLGIKDENAKFIDTVKERMKAVAMPAEVVETVNEELERLGYLKGSDMHSAKSYLDWISQLPWGVYSPEMYDVNRARQILDEDHYGLEDVKNRVLEAIAVMAVKNRMLGKIICLVGPPGTGKTSFAKSIARALGREFARFSVGGLNRVSEIKGHRRTYVGSMPGKIIQSIKQVKTSNPVILLDEIDKMSYFSHHAGDPSASILEVLDPEQNGTFIDDFLDVPYDLSKVLFICTANDLSSLSAPLLDRMEIVRLEGYLTDEKCEIARRFLIPKALKANGLTGKDDAKKLIIEDDVIENVIRDYSREPGVRQLEKNIEKICRKAALKVLSEGLQSVTVSSADLVDYLGKPKYLGDSYYEQPPPGIVMGLGANNQGGSGLFVETVAEQLGTKPELQTTGHMGDVMRESVQIAYTYSKNLLRTLLPDNNFFLSSTLHINWLHGGIPKDGPSGGCAIVTSLVSLALNIPVPKNITMTGEITLHGRVLAIGGVKEKTMAGRRAGATTFIFPRANKPDFDKLPDHMKVGIAVHFVDDYRDIVPIVFPTLRVDFMRQSEHITASSI